MLQTPDDFTLSDIDERIGLMERRLRNAKAARNAYVDYLRGKYPQWRPTVPKDYEHRSLLNRLSTSDYQWDADFTPVRASLPSSESQIVPKYGPLLESEIRSTRRRLMEISSQIRSLNDSRMTLSTLDYHRTAPLLNNYKPLTLENEGSSMANIRQKLSQIEMSSNYEPPRTPTREDWEDERMRNEKYRLIQDIREGRLPGISNKTSSSPPPPPEKPISPEVPEKATVKFQEPIISETKSPPTSPEPVKEHRSEEIVPKIEPKPVEERSESAYTKMMSLLGGNESDSDTENKTQTKPSTGSGLLSQYITRNDGMGSNVNNNKAKRPSMAQVLQQNDSDDDDFFD